MEKLFFLSVVCFLLTGCFGPKNKEYDYPQNNLRAPVSASSAATNVPERKTFDMPQSITQPTPAVSQPVQQAQQQPQQQMQQPLVQTIVIPQFPYGSMPMQNIPMPGVDLNNFSAANMPASYQNNAGNAVNNAANTINVPATPVNPSTIPVPQIKMPARPTVNTQPKESVYPAWAASDYTPPSGYNVSDAMLYFKHPQYNETVQCAAVDSMCINTYKQQGYQQVSGDNGFAQKQDAGYPRTPSRESENNNIPRW